MRAYVTSIPWLLTLLVAVNWCGAQTNYWRNTTGDSQWANPLNWSLGTVPTSASYPIYFDDSGLSNGGTVDLGGQVRTSPTLVLQEQISPASFLFVNGTLKLDRISSGSHYNQSPSAFDTIAANVTTGSTELQLWGTTGLTVSGVIGGNGGAGRNDFSLLASATLTGANTYSGVTTTYGTLTFAGASGSSLNSPAFLIGYGELALDNSVGANPSRLSATAPINVRFGTFTFRGNPSVPVTETLGALTLGAGANQLNVVSGGAETTAVFQSLLRNARSTLNISTSSPGMPDGAAKFANAAGVQLAGAGGPSASPTVSILPYAASYGPQGVSLVTYDYGPDHAPGTPDDVGLRTLNTATEYAPTIAVGTASNSNVRLSSPQTVSADSGLNSLVLSNSGVTLSPGVTLSVSGGAVAMERVSAPETVIDGGNGSTLNFGANEGVFHTATTSTANPQRFAINVTVAGTGGVTKSGPGTLVLNRANTFTGGLTINQGQVISAAQGALGPGAITLTGYAGLGFEGVSQTVANNIVLDTSFTWGTNEVLSSVNYFNVASGLSVTLNGNISGGTFDKRGPGTLRVNGAAGGMGCTEGSLYFNGTSDDGGFNSVASGALFGGTGTIHGMLELEAGGVLAPGDPTGTLTVDRILGINPAAKIQFHLNGASPGQYSELDIVPGNGTYTNPIGGTLNLVLGYQPQVGDSYTIVNDFLPWAQPGRFTGLPEGAQFNVNGDLFNITYHGGDGNDVVVSVVAVPEPCTGMVALTAALCCFRRCRKA